MDDPIAELLNSKAELDQEELERLLRENRALKSRLDEVERENRLLKQRNYDLSMRYGRSAENRRQAFELAFSDSDGDGGLERSSNVSETNDVVEERSEAGAEYAETVDRGTRRNSLSGQSARSTDRQQAGGPRATDRQVEGEPAEKKGLRDGATRRREGRQLKCYAELEGHSGAIYATQYSPTGELVASASFDKTVRLWDVGEQKTRAVLTGHSQSVFDVAWRADAGAVASAGFDRQCIEWDVSTQAETVRLECSGLVQCLRYSTHNPRVVYAGDSAGMISIHDTRQAGTAAPQRLENGAMVTTLFCLGDAARLVSGDRGGEIKMWDVRMGRSMPLVRAAQQPISHISVVRNEKSGTEYMAASCYDNALRVYDRVDDPSVPTPRVIHELRGVRSRNWPIKNAFLDPRVAQEQLGGLYDDDYYELDTRSQSEARGLRSMLFLLTGSAEPFAYLYKLPTHAGPAHADDKTRRASRQRLDGHSDRVYAVATHPTEIKACTAGADSTIRLWHIPSAGRLLNEGYRAQPPPAKAFSL
ncbi:hypothetical protein GGF46_000749 [Coemansia sp. RSA 552]|nr:hypothetical protein GGF46_000749 [Coemansia sp. RSA 552]